MYVRALQLTAPGVIDKVVFHAPGHPAHGEVLIAVKRVSICGSDLRLFRGEYGGPSVYPLVFGHEWSGIVLETGPEVTNVAPGDNVTGDCSRWCGRCPACFVDRNLCEHIEKFGITRNGFSSERVIVPAQYLYRAPATIGADVLALAEMFAVARHSVRRLIGAGANPASPALVLGAGPLGVASGLLMRHEFGWRDIEFFDPVAARLELAHDIDPASSIRAERPCAGQGLQSYSQMSSTPSFATVVIATANASALQNAVALARPRGFIACLGMAKSVPFDCSTVVLKALTVIGSIGGTGDFPQVIQFFAREAITVRKLITDVYPYTEAVAAFSRALQVERNLKLQLDFDVT